MSKKCPKCGNKEIIIDKHEFAYCTDCEMYEPMEWFAEQSVFDRITASPEVLAEKLVYCDDEGVYWHSTIVFSKMFPDCLEDFKTEAEAIAATVAKLKEVAE